MNSEEYSVRSKLTSLSITWTSGSCHGQVIKSCDPFSGIFRPPVLHPFRPQCVPLDITTVRSNNMAEQSLTVAIIGGGFAGTTLANALLHLPHITFQLFEAAPEFSERGAGVGLSMVAQRALEACLNDSKEVLRKAGTVPIEATRYMMVRQPAPSRPGES